MRQVDEVLKTDRRGAIETNCRGHVAWKPAIGRQEGKARQVSGISGQRIAEPAPDDAIMLHYRVASRSIGIGRSEEHTSELQSLMRNSYAVFCLKKKH